jgi:anti-sigma factor RsiW
MKPRDEALGRDTADEYELHAFVDGRLTPRQREQFQDRLAGNGHEADRVAAFRRQQELFDDIRSSLGMQDSERFAPSLRKSLHEVMGRHRRQRRLMLRGMAAAAAASVALVVGLATLDTPAELQIFHQAEAPQFPFGGSFVVPAAIEPSNEGEKSLAWFAEQFAAQTLRPASLEALGLRLVGGSVISDEEAPAVRLVLLDEEERAISLYVGVLSRSVRAAFTMVPEGHLSLHWRNGRLIFALVGSVESPRLLEIMQQISESVGQEVATPASVAVVPPAPGDPAGIEPAAANPVQPIGLPAEPGPAGSAMPGAVLPDGAKAPADPAVVPVVADETAPKNL